MISTVIGMPEMPQMPSGNLARCLLSWWFAMMTIGSGSPHYKQLRQLLLVGWLGGCFLLFVVVCCCLETSCAKAINADVGSSKLPVSFQGMIQDIMFFHSCHFH